MPSVNASKRLHYTKKLIKMLREKILIHMSAYLVYTQERKEQYALKRGVV